MFVPPRYMETGERMPQRVERGPLSARFLSGWLKGPRELISIAERVPRCEENNSSSGPGRWPLSGLTARDKPVDAVEVEPFELAK
jgi:hypothetical protein